MFTKLALVASFVLLTEGFPKRKLPVINIHLYLGKDGDVKTATSTDQTLDKIPSGVNRASCLGVECKSSPNRAANTMELVCCGYIDNHPTPEPEQEFGGDYSDDSGSSENKNSKVTSANDAPAMNEESMDKSSANDSPAMNEETRDKMSANDAPEMNEESMDKSSANDAPAMNEEAMDKTSANDAPAMNEESMDKTSANDAPAMNEEAMDKSSANDAPAMNEEAMDKSSANDSPAMNEETVDEETNNRGFHSDMKDESEMENKKEETISESTGSDMKGDGMTHMSEDDSSAEKPRGYVEKNRSVDTEMAHDEKVATRSEMSKGEKAALCEGIVCTGENRPNKYISSICCLNK